MENLFGGVVARKANLRWAARSRNTLKKSRQKMRVNLKKTS